MMNAVRSPRQLASCLRSANRDGIDEEQDVVPDEWFTSAPAPMVQDPLAVV